MPNQPATPVWGRQGWEGGGGKALLRWQPVIASPCHPSKDGRATDSSFALFWGYSVWLTDGTDRGRQSLVAISIGLQPHSLAYTILVCQVGLA